MKNKLAQLMEDNLDLVWGQHDASIRIQEMEKLYAHDATLLHVDDRTEGIRAINENITKTLNQLPADFVFTLLRPVVINNEIGRLLWGLGPRKESPTVSGMDIAVFENGQIKRLYVFLD